MQDLTIATAQFESRNGDKAYNLSVIEKLSRKAAERGAQVVSFHELCITSYGFLRKLSREQITALAEEVPQGESILELTNIARRYKITLLAGLVEKQGDQLYNTYVCVNEHGMLAKFRKLHPFISPYLSPGNEYVTFDLHGWKCGMLICYDNNVIENVRATALLGANIIFAPHVTGCTPSPMPGRGYVEQQLWENRRRDPVPLRMEFDGPKGRGWLMRWLPARAYDNGVYVVFSNPIGMDDDQLKGGNSMILDPFGEVLTEVRCFEDEIALATCTAEKLQQAGGFRYRKARRPELYREIIGKDHQAETKPVWLKGN
ncbi:nitrilase family protein [Catalinimonas niigatensis]|uniref:nitrilase family protein n=1 Tax=Catalinimonas niigatensis TaxID=1397264 RepID=UPI002666CF4E|nr:nitrilase family protein [Catalinimonas niigatensis]WPP53693.1 nitrilase family protein [Catalinimonas niigatensis]